MKTDAKEFKDLLYRISSNNKPQRAVLLPSDEKIYTINLNSKKIEAPEFLSVKTDHTAETIYFRCARFFDHMDLANTTCVVQYINANKKGGLYFIPYYDIITLQASDEMILPWTIGGLVTEAEGEVEFSIRFYIAEGTSENYHFNYVLNTLSSKSKVLVGMDTIKTLEEDLDIEHNLEADLLDQIFTAIAQSKTVLYWDEII